MPYQRSTTRRLRLRSTLGLERAMRHRDVNASELAKLAKTSRQTISNLRRGAQAQTGEPVARRIADALRVDLAELFDVDADERQESA
jgi:transcriptional regulator with XRE-family HTH domain